MWSHHDYTIAVTGGSEAGAGYSNEGWASADVQDHSYQARPGRPAYDPEQVPFDQRLTERRDYLADVYKRQVETYFDVVATFDDFYEEISDGIFRDQPVDPARQDVYKRQPPPRPTYARPAAPSWSRWS